MISRERYVAFIRYLLAFGAGLALLLPLALVLITASNSLLLKYPTAHLLTLATSIMVIGFVLSVLAPILKNFMIKNVFPGSYDYEQKLKNLAGELAQNPNIDDRISYCNNALRSIIGVARVEFGAQAKKGFNIKVPTPDGINNWFSFGPKFNHDPWTKNDRRRLKWFSSSVAVTLNLEKQRQLEKRRLAQIKKKVLLGTQSLKKLNRDLQQREKDLALQFDELAHDLKNPIAITLNTLVELKKADNRQALDNLCAEAAWMNKSTGHLLDLARAEAGKIILNKKILNIYRLVQDTRDYLYDFAAAQDRTIEWAALTTHTTNTFIEADDKLVHQLLKLLFTWSLRATKKNLTLSLTTDLSGKYVFLDFIIRPIAKIKRQTQEDLLNQFTRAWSHHRDRRHGITGMELVLAQWILKEHKSSLSIAESDQNRVVLRATLRVASPKSSLPLKRLKRAENTT